MRHQSTIFALAAASSAFAAPSTERRFFFGTDSDDLCFGQCNPIGGFRTGVFDASCECYPSFAGKCCMEQLPCEELEVKTVHVDLEEFSRATWYTQWQQVTPFEPLNSLYCVNAAYDFAPTAPKPATYTATNAGTLESVDGKVNSAVACLAESDVPGRLRFAPCPVFGFGGAGNDFLVVDIGVDRHGRYEWAIVFGGQPTERLADGKCGLPNGVFALLTRAPEASRAQLLEMNDVLVKQGLSTNLLVKVEQEGCNYDGIRIKDGLNDGPGPVPPKTFTPQPGSTFLPPTGAPAGTPPPTGPPAGVVGGDALVFCPNGRPQGTPGANC